MNTLNTEEKLVNILNEMSEYLNEPQMKDRAVLQEAPFNNMGSLGDIFDSDLATLMDILRTIDSINANALAA